MCDIEVAEVRTLLRWLVLRNGYRMTLHELRKSFFRAYRNKNFNPQNHGCETMTQLIMNFTDLFRLYRTTYEIYIELIDRSIEKSKFIAKCRLNATRGTYKFHEDETSNTGIFKAPPSNASRSRIGSSHFSTTTVNSSLVQEPPLPPPPVLEAIPSIELNPVMERFMSERTILADIEEISALHPISRTVTIASSTNVSFERPCTSGTCNFLRSPPMRKKNNSTTSEDEFESFCGEKTIIPSTTDSSEYNINNVMNDQVSDDEKEEESIIDDDDDIEMMCKNQASKEEDSEIEKLKKEVLSDLEIDDPILLMGFPEINCDPNYKLSIEAAPKNFEVESIYVAEIYSPVQFWFQFESSDVQKMMEDLQADYTKLAEHDLQISDVNLKVGLIVACYVSDFGLWHRAVIIKSINEKRQLRLFFIDYGTVGKATIKNVKYLFKSYLVYPRFSYRGRLAGVKPPNGALAWSENQVNKFIQHVANREMQATVVKYDEPNDVYELELKHEERRTTKRVNLKKWIVKNCLADAIVLRLRTDGTPFETIGPLCYHVPTFKLLETTFPSFHEKSVMLAQNIDLDELIRTNFFKNVDYKTLGTSSTLLRMMGTERYKILKDLYFS